MTEKIELAFNDKKEILLNVFLCCRTLQKRGGQRRDNRRRFSWRNTRRSNTIF